jgi:uncharacterized lipoprotein NlpE involved in copper resistance
LKKLIIIILVVTLTFTLLGCSSQQKQSQTAPETAEKKAEDLQQEAGPNQAYVQTGLSIAPFAFIA